MSFTFNPFTGNFDYYKSSLSSTNYVGSDCTGTDGSTNRTLTASATMIVVDNQFLHPTVDYSVTSGVITFVNQLWDSQKITIWN